MQPRLDRRSLLKLAAASPLVLLGTTEATEQSSCSNECENSGMSDIPVTDGFCDGCKCVRCGARGSMNSMGWCDVCEEELRWPV